VGFLFLREAITWSMILGAAIILAGTYLVTTTGKKRAAKTTEAVG